ncbi:CLAVATA3/ESR (CLE)-related protein 25 [Quillaja saponaria]|uniref:CLAVATA3/ESR (CLE)-related protein 25 n=1 Tax=Quillaja saponaria TaxID=32244 RepID=A0AAD7VBM6_QUISA|nr:CLAVATA3/ESR (CLE)-related protein 25 [Quillaja saponaria]
MFASSTFLFSMLTWLPYIICEKRKKNMGVRGGGRSIRVFFGALVFLGVICFMFLAIPVKAEIKTTIEVPSHGIFKFIGRERHQNFEWMYVSKRRVPNGPDPIHNRKAVNSRQPPVRA